jgi:hypothetical protein
MLDVSGSGMCDHQSAISISPPERGATAWQSARLKTPRFDKAWIRKTDYPSSCSNRLTVDGKSKACIHPMHFDT